MGGDNRPAHWFRGIHAASKPMGTRPVPPPMLKQQFGSEYHSLAENGIAN